MWQFIHYQHWNTCCLSLSLHRLLLSVWNLTHQPGYQSSAMQDSSLALTWHVAVRQVTWDRNQTQQILPGWLEARNALEGMWESPEMVDNSPSLSGSNEGRQKWLRKKEYITLVQKIWLFLIVHRRRHREKWSKNQGNVDTGFVSFSRLSKSNLCTTKPMACFC